ncbi:MAG: hypothetical protein QXS91_00270 [Candidatus Anstonellales archaeon]
MSRLQEVYNCLKNISKTASIKVHMPLKAFSEKGRVSNKALMYNELDAFLKDHCLKNKKHIGKRRAQLSIEFLLSFAVLIFASAIFISSLPKIKTIDQHYDIVIAKAASCFDFFSIHTSKGVLCIAGACENGIKQEQENECKKSSILD